MSPLQQILIAGSFVIFGGVSAQDAADCSRPPPGWPREPPSCCDQPYPTDDMRKHLLNCIRQYGAPTSAVLTEKSIRERRRCVEECVYRSAGIITKDDNVLQREALESQLRSVATGASWEKAIAASLDACFAEAERFEDSSSSSSIEEDSTCSPIPERITFCLSRQLFLNCPEGTWNSRNEHYNSSKSDGNLASTGSTNFHRKRPRL